MENRLFPFLLKNEPGAVQELTLQDYEERMGIRPKRKPGKEGQDGGQHVGQDTKKENETQVRADRTKKELIAILEERGFKGWELNRKNKQQLIEML